VTFPATNWFRSWLLAELTGQTPTLDLTTSTIWCALFADSVDFSSANFDTQTGRGVGTCWDPANEIVGQSGYTAGGAQFGALTCSTATGTITWGAGAQVVWNSSTLTPQGCVVWTPDVSPDYGLGAWRFDGTPGTINSTFTVTWPTGLLKIL